MVLSFFFGPKPLALVFNGFELGRASCWRSRSPATSPSEGESTWFEGLMLLAVYTVMVVTFLYA